jgi:peptidoglycan/LPS O-acetylase OafA/YrhL
MRPKKLLSVESVQTSGESPPVQQGYTGLRFPALDGLRGMAALGVAIFHYMIGPSFKLPWLARSLEFCSMSPLSIETFFVLSGFLIGGILLQLRDAPDYYRSFYARRALRIWPLYYLWVGLYCVLFLTTHSAAPHGMTRTFYLSSFLLFFQSFYPAILMNSIMLLPTWSLVAEEHFYVLIPIAVRHLSSRGLARVLIGVLIAVPLFRLVLFKFIGHESEWADMAVRYWPTSHADALAMGVLFAMAWRSQTTRDWLHRHLALLGWGMFAGSGLAILLGCLRDAHLPYSRLLEATVARSAQELGCLGLIVYIVCHPDGAVGRFLSSKTLRDFGRISYCIYVIHSGVLWMIFRFVLHKRVGTNLRLDLLVAPVALFVTVALAKISWNYFERPLLQWARGVPKPSYVLAMRASVSASS